MTGRAQLSPDRICVLLFQFLFDSLVHSCIPMFQQDIAYRLQNIKQIMIYTFFMLTEFYYQTFVKKHIFNIHGQFRYLLPSEHHGQFKSSNKIYTMFPLINLCHWGLVFSKASYFCYLCLQFSPSEIANTFHRSHFLFSLWILPHVSIYFYNLFFWPKFELSINEIIWKKLP